MLVRQAHPDILQSDFYPFLQKEVLLVPLIEISPDDSQGVITEMRELRKGGHLITLRGGRATDLPRPLSQEVREQFSYLPNILRVVRRVEEALAGTSLFLRTIKYDEARASSTSPDENRTSENIHFDHPYTPFSRTEAPVYQFYLNLGQEPRTFRVGTVCLKEVIQWVKERFDVPNENIEPSAALRLYLQENTFPQESCLVPSGSMTIFDGRAFAHDAGKGTMSGSTFVPSAEPDIVMAIDTAMTIHHEGLYDPSSSFLD